MINNAEKMMNQYSSAAISLFILKMNMIINDDPQYRNDDELIFFNSNIAILSYDAYDVVTISTTNRIDVSLVSGNRDIAFCKFDD